jgi:hypothetical protein
LLGRQSVLVSDEINSSAIEMEQEYEDRVSRDIRDFRCAKLLLEYGNLNIGDADEMSRNLECEANRLIALSLEEGNIESGCANMPRMTRETFGIILMPAALKRSYMSNASKQGMICELWERFAEVLNYSMCFHSAGFKPSKAMVGKFCDAMIDVRVLIAALKQQSICNGVSWRKDYPWMQNMINCLTVYSPDVDHDGVVEHATLGAIARDMYLEEVRRLL